jgi:hypothetical protein
MIRHFLKPIALNFWASPHESMALIAHWGTVRSERNSFSIKALDPGFWRDGAPEVPKPRTLPEFPTDVPMPEPHDVPVPEPIDPPVPDPGKSPPVTKPKAPNTDPKPRSAP